jgi:Zn-dependent protease with chaperone function
MTIPMAAATGPLASRQISAFYFDGKSSRRQSVTLHVQDHIATIRATDADASVIRSCPLTQLRVSERFSHAVRKVIFTDGACLEIQDLQAFSALLQDTRHRESLVVRLQHSWRASLAALLALIILLVLSYLYLLPAAANVLAHALPVSIERQIGDRSLEFLDERVFAPTRLPMAQRTAITARFQALTTPLDDVPPFEILFRQSRIGANALALPSGQIVLTDELVQLLHDDDAVMGVLGHELGHLQRRHLMRRLIQGSVVGAASTLLFGDVSAILVNVPALLLDLKYSRDFEREADDYALALFRINGISRQKLAEVFEKLASQTDAGHALPPYLSSHPANAERIERILHAP